MRLRQSPHSTRRLILQGGLVTVLMSLSPTAFAHRQARSETQVVVHDTGRIDVTHIFHVHDVQRAFFRAGLIETPDLSPIRARARLALHTKETFSLHSDDGEIPLDVIDAEIIGHNAHVYQEGQLEGSLRSVSATMLRELIPAQINSVNVVMDGTTTTLDFSGQDGPKVLNR